MSGGNGSANTWKRRSERLPQKCKKAGWQR